jgi:hypothetical protein
MRAATIVRHQTTIPINIVQSCMLFSFYQAAQHQSLAVLVTPWNCQLPSDLIASIRSPPFNVQQADSGKVGPGSAPTLELGEGHAG